MLFCYCLINKILNITYAVVLSERLPLTQYGQLLSVRVESQILCTIFC